MFYIPESILVEILSRLPVKCLMRFKCVDKLWCNLISSSYFITFHLNYCGSNSKYILVNSFDTSKHRNFVYLLSLTTDNNLSVTNVKLPFKGNYKVHSSCNGVVCLQGRVDEIALWNPVIRDFKLIRSSNISRPNFSTTCSIAEVGFGFDPKTNDYKILQTVFSGRDHHQFELYSLRSDSWKKLEPEDYVPCSNDRRGATCLSFNNKNTICWIAIAKNAELDYIWEIVSFDLSDEKFDILQLPPAIATSKVCRLEMLFPLRESIAVISQSSLSTTTYHTCHDYDIWVSEDVANNSWIKLLSVRFTDVSGHFTKYSLGFLGNGQLIFNDDCENVVLYDISTTQQIKHLVHRRWPYAKAFEFKRSLVAISKLQKGSV